MTQSERERVDLGPVGARRVLATSISRDRALGTPPLPPSWGVLPRCRSPRRPWRWVSWWRPC